MLGHNDEINQCLSVVAVLSKQTQLIIYKTLTRCHYVFAITFLKKKLHRPVCVIIIVQYCTNSKNIYIFTFFINKTLSITIKKCACIINKILLPIGEYSIIVKCGTFCEIKYSNPRNVPRIRLCKVL